MAEELEFEVVYDPLPPRASQRDWLAEARRAVVDHDANRANYAAREAIALDGGNADAWRIRAESSLELGHLDDAEFEARETIRLAPQVAEAHEMLASIFLKKERYNDATGAAEEAVRLAPDKTEFTMTLAMIHVKAGKPRQAIRLLEPFQERDKDDASVANLLAVALYLEAELQTTQLPHDEHVITSAEQIAVIRRNTLRGLALPGISSGTRDDLRAIRAEADRAEQTSWHHSGNLFGYWVVVLVTFVVALPALTSINTALLGLLLWAVCGGTIYLYIRRHRKPRWAWNALEAPDVIRRG